MHEATIRARVVAVNANGLLTHFRYDGAYGVRIYTARALVSHPASESSSPQFQPETCLRGLNPRASTLVRDLVQGMLNQPTKPTLSPAGTPSRSTTGRHARARVDGYERAPHQHRTDAAGSGEVDGPSRRSPTERRLSFGGRPSHNPPRGPLGNGGEGRHGRLDGWMYPTTAPRLVIRSPNPKSGFNIRGGGSSKHPVCTVYPSRSLASDLASVGRAGGMVGWSGR